MGTSVPSLGGNGLFTLAASLPQGTESEASVMHVGGATRTTVRDPTGGDDSQVALERRAV